MGLLDIANKLGYSEVLVLQALNSLMEDPMYNHYIEKEKTQDEIWFKVKKAEIPILIRDILDLMYQRRHEMIE